ANGVFASPPHFHPTDSSSASTVAGAAPPNGPARSPTSTTETSGGSSAPTATAGTTNPGSVTGEPFANPFDDWSDSVDSALGTRKHKPPRSGGPGGQGGGGGGETDAGSPAPLNLSATGPTPGAANRDTSSDALWSILNGLGESRSSVVLTPSSLT